MGQLGRKVWSPAVGLSPESKVSEACYCSGLALMKEIGSKHDSQKGEDFLSAQNGSSEWGRRKRRHKSHTPAPSRIPRGTTGSLISP